MLRPDGGAEGVRTPDLLNAIQALYQLSYDPIRGDEKSKTCPENVKVNFQRQSQRRAAVQPLSIFTARKLLHSVAWCVLNAIQTVMDQGAPIPVLARFDLH